MASYAASGRKNLRSVPVIQRQLALYRLHFIDRKSGTIARSFEFHVENDAEAIKFAAVWAEECAPMELRSGKGRVMSWPIAGSNDS
jgi:hypothetical protein